MSIDAIEDLIEDISAQARRSGRHSDAVARYYALAEEHPEAAAPALVAAGEMLALTGDHEGALEAFRAAVGARGHVPPDVRCYLVDGLLKVGRYDEAAAVVDEVHRSHPEDPWAYEFIGEAYEEIGELATASRWLTIGMMRSLQDDDDDGALTLMIGRRRVRQKQGLPPDDYDQEAAEELVDRQQAYDDGGRPVIGVLYWPAAEFKRLRHQLPALAADYGETHEAHVEEVERALRAYAAQGDDVAVCIAVGTVDSFLTACSAADRSPSEGSARAHYAATLTRAGQTLAWPPARKGQCWCGSGRRYKQCCALVT